MTTAEDSRDPARSRLARMIARLEAQRACLALAQEAIRDIAGPVLEIGLGKGRTYDHLRRLLPEREIFAFDRDIHAPADCVPDAEHMIQGDFRDTLPAAVARIGRRRAALVHADIGSEDRARDAALATAIVPAIVALLRPGGIALCDRDLGRPTGWVAVPPPAAVDDWPYFLYRAER